MERFDPKTIKFPYPEDTGTHYLKVKKNDGTVFDEHYPFIDASKKFKRKQWWLRLGLHLLAHPLMGIRTGLRIKGKENLKKHKDVLDKGAVSISNHIHMWDYIGISKALWPRKTNVLSWAPDISGENGKMIRLVGGIPIPEDDFRATAAYMKAVRNLLKEGGWLHIYAEGSMWEYYGQIRPFKRGAAYFAIKEDKPILPMAYSFRKPGWIRRKIFKQIALLTLNIGEPIYANKTLPEREQEKDLLIRAHEAVCRLADIDPKKNLYPPIYDNSRRIDYYTKEYGVGYKGSW